MINHNNKLSFRRIVKAILAPAVILVVQAVAEADLAALEGAAALLEVAVEVSAMGMQPNRASLLCEYCGDIRCLLATRRDLRANLDAPIV